MKLMFIPATLASIIEKQFGVITLETIERANKYDKEYIVALNNHISSGWEKPKIKQTDPLNLYSERFEILGDAVNDEYLFIIIPDQLSDELVKGNKSSFADIIVKIIDFVGLEKGRAVVALFNYYMK